MIPLRKSAVDFLSSEEGIAIRKQLEKMAGSDSYNTTSSYSANTEIYSDNLIPFVDKHLYYLAAHSGINPALYISNLRLMTRRRGSSIAP